MNRAPGQNPLRLGFGLSPSFSQGRSPAVERGSDLAQDVEDPIYPKLRLIDT